MGWVSDKLSTILAILIAWFAWSKREAIVSGAKSLWGGGKGLLSSAGKTAWGGKIASKLAPASNFLKNSKIGQFGSKIGGGSASLGGGVLAAGFEGINAYGDYQDAKNSGASDKQLSNIATKGVAKTTGAGLGAWGGAAIGTEIGLALAPFTFGISALVGPLLGAAAGSWAGAEAADGLIDAMLENNGLLKKTDKEDILKIASMSSGAPSASRISDIMNAKKLDVNDDKKATNEKAMANVEQSTLKQNIIINQQIDGRLKARIIGH